MRRRSPRGWRLLAPAKVNLDLRVLRRRADGFHDIRTIFQSVSIVDTVTVRSRRGPLTVRSRAARVPRDRDNLVWRAGAALWRALDRPGDPAGAGVTIVKRIPAAAGLGGASSDAAAALRGLALLWAPGLSRRTIRQVAVDVGSDVPFFFDGGTVVATGRGERTRRLPAWPRHHLVLAAPSFGVSTPEAYGWWDEATAVGDDSSAPLPSGWRRHLSSLRNELQPAVAGRHPEIDVMVDKLRQAGAAMAAMTGSGSVVFGVFRSAAAATTARRLVRRPGWRTWVVHTVTDTEYARLAAPARID